MFTSRHLSSALTSLWLSALAGEGKDVRNHPEIPPNIPEHYSVSTTAAGPDHRHYRLYISNKSRGNVLFFFFMPKSLLQSTERLEGFPISKTSGVASEPLPAGFRLMSGSSRVTRRSDDGGFVARLLLRSAVYGHVPQRRLNTSVRFPPPQIFSSL